MATYSFFLHRIAKCVVFVAGWWNANCPRIPSLSKVSWFALLVDRARITVQQNVPEVALTMDSGGFLFVVCDIILGSVKLVDILSR